MGIKINERLSHRLTDMLYRLNPGETLDPKPLVEYYSSSVRTVYRDITECFAYLPIKKVRQGYNLAVSDLGKLDFQYIKHFAVLLGVVRVYPNLERGFLRQLVDRYASKRPFFEDVSLFKHLFEILRPVMIDRRHIRVMRW